VGEARVIIAMPRGEFEPAALAAVRGWRPAPAAAPARRETRRFEFRLPDTSLATVPATTLGSAPFPMAACEQRGTGRVALEVETDATGRVLKARILEAEPAGLFDGTALAIARGSRLSPAWRDGQPMAAVALLTLFFDPEQATCPGIRLPERDTPPARRPPPRVGRLDERPVPRAEERLALSRAATQPVP
jgi:TonB family protein